MWITFIGSEEAAKYSNANPPDPQLCPHKAAWKICTVGRYWFSVKPPTRTEPHTLKKQEKKIISRPGILHTNEVGR